MNRHPTWSRRDLMKLAGAGAVAALTAEEIAFADEPTKPKGNVQQSVCRWCYNKVPLDKLAEESKKLGYKSVELLGPQDYLKIKPLGLTCAMLSGGGSITIGNCLNKKENHDAIEKDLRASIEFAAAEGIPNVICFSGNRRDNLSDEEGLAICAEGLKRVVGFAEEKKVTLCMELLNSKVDHKGYMCDKTPWGVALCKKVGSDRFKLLYDIYHMQIMEGDVIRTIKANKDCIAHYHTGGVPGRHEIDETQELHYPAIMRAILETGYKGFVGQEYIPARDPLPALAQGFKICDV